MSLKQQCYRHDNIVYKGTKAAQAEGFCNTNKQICCVFIPEVTFPTALFFWAPDTLSVM